MLESFTHDQSCFVTLTYRDEEVPPDGVRVRDVQLFLKRLRFLCSPIPVRFFAVGEYGDHTWRPHYHVALFGISCPETVSKAWQKGHVHVAEVNRLTMQYLCSHQTKGMMKKLDPRLNGRNPEFQRMSLRPGIGAGSVEDFARFMNSRVGAELLARDSDVVTGYRMDNKMWPIGRYLRRRIRQEAGYPPDRPKEAEYRQVVEAFLDGTPESVKKVIRERSDLTATQRIRDQKLRRQL